MTPRAVKEDVALREFQRALDAFLATHCMTVATCLVHQHVDHSVHRSETANPLATETTVQRDVKRLQGLSAAITTTRQRRGPASVKPVATFLLAWCDQSEASRAGIATDPAASASLLAPVASWLTATLLSTVLQDASASLNSHAHPAVEELGTLLVTRCCLAFQRSWQAQDAEHRRARTERAGTLFSYFRKATPATRGKGVDATTTWRACTIEASGVWGHVWGLVAGWAPDVARSLLQKDLVTQAAAWNAAKGAKDGVRHPYLRHLMPLRLGLTPSLAAPSAALTTRLLNAVKWLRVVMPLLLKPHRSHVRTACAHVVASWLLRELVSLPPAELTALYTSSASDWSRCISDLHAVALRLTDWAKKKPRGRTQQQAEAASWALRTVVLALAPNDIYTRYWRDDALALLRLQSHLNQDAATAHNLTAYHVLPSLDVSFTSMMQRHLIVRASGPSNKGIPSESEVMDIINTTQAWAFFSLPRLRPQAVGTAPTSAFRALTTSAVPAFQHVTRAMASYNLTYTIESHVRRLIAESIGVGDPQKLVGLEALVYLVAPCAPDEERLASFHVHRNDVMAHQAMLGELLSRVLLECKTRFGHHVLAELTSVQTLLDDRDAVDTKDVDDEKHWSNPTHAVAVATFGAAVRLLPVFYAHVSLSDEEKLGLLVRALVNADASVRRRAHEALLALVAVPERLESEPLLPTADQVIRALIEYILQLNVSPSPTVSDAAGAMTILRTLRVLFAPPKASSLRWASAQARAQAIVHVEALAVYLLVRGEDNREAEQLLRQAVVATLQVAHAVRSKSCHDQATVDQRPVDRPSVWTLVHALESEFQTAFFTYAPEAPTGLNPSSVLDRLLYDPSVRHRFRWSLALARILQRVESHASEVTALLYPPVAAQVQKLEPVLSVTPRSDDSPSDPRALSRWRDFALLAMIAAGPSVQPHVSAIADANHVAPSTLVASLVRQLACYLRSTHVGQRQTAAFVLGHAGANALSTVLDVLARLQTEAVVMAGNDDREALESTKLPKKRAREAQHARAAQIRLQWAIGRCYRLLIESRTCKESEAESAEPPIDASLCRAVAIHVTHMVATFDQDETIAIRAARHETVATRSRTSSINDTSELFLMQLDFMALYHFLVLQASTEPLPSLPVSKQHIATMLLTWCGPFEQTLAHASLSGHFHAGFLAHDKEAYSQWMQHCDVSTARDRDVLYPKLWIETLAPLHKQDDTSRRVLQYLICHRAFSLLATMVRQRPEVDAPWDDSRLDSWLEACFHLDTVHFDYLNDLQHFAHRALHAQFDWPSTSSRFHHVLHHCLEKATYALTRATASERRVARQYLKALGASRNALAFATSLLHRLQHERGAVHDKDQVALAVRLLHVLVLHVGTPHDAASAPQDQHPVALAIVATLVSTSSTDRDEEETAALCWSLQSSTPSSLASRRMHVTVSALLASHFPVLSLDMSLTLLHALSSLSLDSLTHVTQQHQMLAAVLPWLAEVSLAPRTAASTHPSDLLAVLYHVTATQSVVCRDQVEHAWLTLAFARNDRDDRNVDAIVTFLYHQALASHVPSEAARSVVGSLCLWEDVAIDVLHTLVAVARQDAGDQTTAGRQRAAVVTLASDASGHLVQCQVHPDAQALTLHLLHVALTTLFEIQERTSIDDQETSDLRQHCHGLLHSLLPLLQAPRHRLQAAFTAMQAATRPGTVDKKKKTHRAAFVNALQTLTTVLSTSESTCWSEVCVHEIAIAVAPEASVPRRDASSVSLRFALVAYPHVTHCFQGDVLLSVLTLLRQALSTSGSTDPSTSLACVCLAFIAQSVDTMPDSKLVLYPQIFWVAVALLTHCRQGSCPRWTIHAKALTVLSRLWQRTPFVAHPIVHDVVRATRPASWQPETAHTSVVMEIVRSAYASESVASRARALEMLHQAVLLVPCPLLGVSRLHHVIICTLSLLPALIVSSTAEDQGWNDLVMLWQHSAIAATNPMIEWLQAWQCNKPWCDVAATFGPVFVPALHALARHEHGQQPFTGFTLSLFVLTACLPSPGKASTPTSLYEQQSEVVLKLLEALCQECVRRNVPWPPVPEVHATLARHLQSPRSEQQWQLAMRVVTWMAEGEAKAPGTD